jgi:hypothetical protein
MQIVIFVVLIVYNFHVARKMPNRLFAGFEIAKDIVTIIIFVYFFLNWSTVVNPTLRTASIIGMAIINLLLLWHVLLTRAELPYQTALNACVGEPKSVENYQTLVSKGKHYYYLRYFWRALFSGKFSRRFLHDIAAEQIRYDLQTAFQREGITKYLINFKMLMAYLRQKLATDETLPVDFREIITKAIGNFEHPWIEVQVNEFLEKVSASPEDLFASELASRPEG